MWPAETSGSANEAIGSRADTATLSAAAAAGIVHDLGNLIQIASSAVNIVARRLSSDTSDLNPVIAGAKTSLERAGVLVRQTIGVAREGTAEVE